MIVGLPQGLLYYKYKDFFKVFFEEIGCDLLISEDTNKTITQQGIRYCTSEACFPIKVFHGHVVSLKDQCDLLVIPRIIKVCPNDYICPHLCSLPEMVMHSIINLPQITYQNLYFNSQKQLYNWSLKIGNAITKNRSKIDNAFNIAMVTLQNNDSLIYQNQFKYRVLLLGHDYLIHDAYLNQNIIKKLNEMDIGIITPDCLNEEHINHYIKALTRKPFWNFYKKAYSNATFLTNKKSIDGIVFLSSFGCGIDSIIYEVLKEDMPQQPLLMIKVDEHTGDAGLDTRLEAFSDMLDYRCRSHKRKDELYDCNSTTLR